MKELFDLLIVDDIFPSKKSAFRLIELSSLLKAFPRSLLLTTGQAYACLGDGGFSEDLADYCLRNEMRNRVQAWDGFSWDDSWDFKLAYTIFLNNIYSIVELLEEKAIPFVFELYPGGGFAIGNPESDQKLERVLRSPCFRRVIVTQDITRRYIQEKHWCDAAAISDVFGVLVESSVSDIREISPEAQKLTLGFCSFKYSPQGRDKGYDIFIETAKRLHTLFPQDRFKVIGTFSREDIDVSELGDSISFLGVLTSQELASEMKSIDIILSPVRDNVLSVGSFDGFPTAGCITAALNGALVMTSDPMNQNGGRFTSGYDIEILPPYSNFFFQRISYYHRHIDRLNIVRKRQMEHMQLIFSEEAQVLPRQELLSEEINHFAQFDRTNLNYSQPEKTEIPIMHCFDNNYVIPAAASFYSMLKHADPRFHYALYVLHTDITSQSRDMLQRVVSGFSNASLTFINMENRFEDIWKRLTFSGHFSKEVLYKLLVPSIFPQYNKIIITDVDVVFCGDISASYFALSEDEPVCFAGVRHVLPKGTWLDSYYDNYTVHFGKGSRDELKVCGGYLVANLRYMRETNKEDQFLSFLSQNAYRLLQSEQDVINFCCTDEEIKYLPLNNVVCSYMYDLFPSHKEWPEEPFYSAEQIRNAMEFPIQLHYATGTKPWNEPLSTKAEEWIKYLAEAGAYREYVLKETRLKEKSPVCIAPELVGQGLTDSDGEIMLSVLCCTYNHEKFIRDALEGMVSQEVDFPIEIIVADDASTDDTRNIIAEYAEKYPGLIRCLLREENMGIGENYYDALCHVRGKYLALCDGDDCWTDKQKLKKQVEYLEAHPSCNICCTSFVQRTHKGDTFEDEPFSVQEYIKNVMPPRDQYTFEDLLYCRFIASCTTVLRWQFIGRVPDFLRYYSVIDFPLSLLHAASGSIHVMYDVYSAIYNVHAESITEAANEKLVRDQRIVIAEVNQYLEYRFAHTIADYFSNTKRYFELKEQKKCSENGEVRLPLRIRLFLFLYKVYEHMPPFVRRAWKRCKRFISRRDA